MDFYIKAFQLLASLSILVVLHELGHFIPAKLFKTRVEKFYLFFDPWFSLFKKKVGGTEYGIGWLPLGGYVKISGMIDESMDKEQMKKPAEAWEFRAKPAWQRLIIMLGGVFVNLVLGMFIYAMTLFVYGDKYLPNENLKEGVWCVDDFSKGLGFENGDKFVSIDGEKIERFSSILEKLVVAKRAVVEREGVLIEVVLPENFVEQLLNNGKTALFFPRMPTFIAGFTENSSCREGGLLVGDNIVSINGVSTKYHDQVVSLLKKHKDTVVKIGVLRGEAELFYSVGTDEDGVIGFYPQGFSFLELEKLGYYDLKSKKYGFFESFPAGYKKALRKLGSYIDQFKLILNPSSGAHKGVGGFGSIGSLFPSEWDWERFWNLTAFLSLMLAFMNILPIPALDGGHVVFLLYEIVVGRPAPEKIVESAQVVGMILLLALLVFANGNDILRLF